MNGGWRGAQRTNQATQAHPLHSIRWVRDHAATYRIDTTRVAVGGSSAGAITAINVAQNANPTHGVVRGRIKVSAALAVAGCNYDLSSIDANDAPISMLHAGGDPDVPYSCAGAPVSRGRAFGSASVRAGGVVSLSAMVRRTPAPVTR